jgi:hypothetical protein
MEPGRNMREHCAERLCFGLRLGVVEGPLIVRTTHIAHYYTTNVHLAFIYARVI